MAVFEYNGLTQSGQNVIGIIDADTHKTARFKLRRSGIFPVEVLESGQSSSIAGTNGQKDLAQESLASRGLDWLGERVTVQELSVLTRQMATLVSAGLPLLEVLSVLAEQVDKRLLKRTLAQVRERVREGSTLADALAQHPRVFSNVFVQMIRVGEASGTLDKILTHLADFLDRQGQMRSQILSAMAYPALMFLVSAGILTFLMSFVIPRVLLVFTDMQQALPLPTRLLMGFMDIFRGYWWVALILLLGAVIVLGKYRATPEGRERWDGIKLKIPMVGRLSKLVSLSRFSDTLSILLKGGVPLLQAFDIVKGVVNNRVLEKALASARENIREGEGIAEPLRRSGVFPPMVTRMIAVGEASAELEGMLEKVSQVYRGEVEVTLSTLMSLLAP